MVEIQTEKITIKLIICSQSLFETKSYFVRENLHVSYTFGLNFANTTF